MKSLFSPNASFAHDRGEPDPALRATLAQAYSGGHEPYLRAVAELCTSRLLLPIVATGDDGGSGPDPDRQAEMAAVMVQAADGSRGIVAFTGLDALTDWNPDARPVPCTLDDVAATAEETGSRVVLIDLQGPHSLVIEHALVTELAQGHRLVEVSAGEFGWMVPNAADPDAEPGPSAG
ncbi:SseB family protein [Nigerium massiliense]|uniref:SseB family protein n=1 Tax=Nigerium massiliense TaxID=1522317 RepID=UPI0009079335|nr:SseB family protein [Nigerium massiliense]